MAVGRRHHRPGRYPARAGAGDLGLAQRAGRAGPVRGVPDVTGRATPACHLFVQDLPMAPQTLGGRRIWWAAAPPCEGSRVLVSPSPPTVPPFPRPFLPGHFTRKSVGEGKSV